MPQIHRRTFLRAAGVSLALPWLEAMQPTQARAAVESPQRLVLICTTLGLHPPSLWPKTPGTNYETTEYLELLQEHRGDYTLFSGLGHEGQTGRQPHNSEMTWLTAARGPGLDGFRNTISLDQFAAGQLGYVTRFPSITLGSNSAQSQSYTSSGVMIPAETSPARMFSQLFLQGKPEELAKQKQQLQDGRSILDQLLSQIASVRRTVGVVDNAQLDEYFESLRKAEREITQAQGWLDRPKPTVEAESPGDIADSRDLVGRTRLLMDLIPLIVQTDSSRVVSVLIQDHFNVPVVDGVSGQHHNLSHHGQDESKIAQLKKIESALVSCFADLLTRMKAKHEAGTSLLDHTSILFGSNLGNANSHDPRNVPIVLAGGGFSHGSYVEHDAYNNAPLCNLFVTLLQNMGLENDSFAQSSGTLTWS